IAMSLDGRTAMRNGDSKWITGAEARADVQLLRARSCAVITGSGTVLLDDPLLNVRLPDYDGKQPLRVLVDSQLRTPVTAATLRVPGEILIACAGDAANNGTALHRAVAGRAQEQGKQEQGKQEQGEQGQGERDGQARHGQQQDG